MKNIRFLRRRYQRGLTLIEASMVLALSAVVIAGVMLYYSSAQANNKLLAAQSELASIQTVMTSIYANSMDMGPAGTDLSHVMDGNSAIPTNLRNASGQVTDPWSSTVAIALNVCDYNGQNCLQSATQPKSLLPNYVVFFYDVPISACVAMATQPLGSLVAVNIHNHKAFPDSNGLISVSWATQTCASEAYEGVLPWIGWQLMK